MFVAISLLALAFGIAATICCGIWQRHAAGSLLIDRATSWKGLALGLYLAMLVLALAAGTVPPSH